MGLGHLGDSFLEQLLGTRGLCDPRTAPWSPSHQPGAGGVGRHSPGGGLASLHGLTAPHRPLPGGQSQRHLPWCLRLRSRNVTSPQLRPLDLQSQEGPIHPVFELESCGLLGKGLGLWRDIHGPAEVHILIPELRPSQSRGFEAGEKARPSRERWSQIVRWAQHPLEGPYSGSGAGGSTGVNVGADGTRQADQRVGGCHCLWKVLTLRNGW